MNSLILLLAVLANIATLLCWHRQGRAGAKARLSFILAGIAAFAISCALLAIPYAWSRAPFIALGLLGLSGWLYVFARPLWLKSSS